MTSATHYWLQSARLPDGWVHGVRLTVDDHGLIRSVGTTDDREGATVLLGAAAPGVPNCHSHAFQRAMAGFAEKRLDAREDFWSWRTLMYGLAADITPDDLLAIASQLYVEMLRAGYTSVAEFHYLHGAPAPDKVRLMSQAVMHAAERVGIRHTHLPVLYQARDFGGEPVEEHQRRFALSTEHYLRLVQDLDAESSQSTLQRIGLAFHSLRAVTPVAMAETLKERSTELATRPIHIHIAEQTAEVEACVAWSGRRPVEWLLEHVDVDDRWCLVHATHMNKSEVDALAASGALAGLCPTTEANLGDGLFPLERYLNAGGRIAIGSDSHVSVSVIEELRWLEYAQRLNARRRSIAADREQPHAGANLWTRATAGGAAALGRRTGQIAPGFHADFVVLDTNHPQLYGAEGDQLLDRLVFCGNANPIRHVVVGGAQVICDARHALQEDIECQFRLTIDRLRKRLLF